MLNERIRQLAYRYGPRNLPPKMRDYWRGRFYRRLETDGSGWVHGVGEIDGFLPGTGVGVALYFTPVVILHGKIYAVFIKVLPCKRQPFFLCDKCGVFLMTELGGGEHPSINSLGFAFFWILSLMFGTHVLLLKIGTNIN